MNAAFHQQLESLLRSHLNAQREALIAVVERAFAADPQSAPRQKRTAPAQRKPSAARRADSEIQALADKAFAAIDAEPGIGMTRLAATLRVSSRELERPIHRLKMERRVRSVGRYQNTRYFPFAATSGEQ
jgi:hypothetical protein